MSTPDCQPRWSADQVLLLAPDLPSVAAGSRLAHGPGWGSEGSDGRAVWGECAGSGKIPYAVAVDLLGPAFRCSCPSRKFPCKHALGLLLRWAEGTVAAGRPPDRVVEWVAGRDARPSESGTVGRGGAVEEGRAEGSTAAEVVAVAAKADAAAARREQREARVSAGLAELDRWLQDQMRTGLAALPTEGHAPFARVAARLVDAQAPGVASWVRGLPSVFAKGSTWPGRMLEEFALLHLLIRAHERLPQLDAHRPDLAATVRAHVGYPVAKESVLATAGIRDRWSVVGLEDSELDRLLQRTVWLTGRATGRTAVVLSFAMSAAGLDSSLVPGTAIEADLHFYPSARPERALLGTIHSLRPEAADPPVARRCTEAVALVSDAIAKDPWTRSVATWVEGVPTSADGGGRWALVDARGDALPLRSAGPPPWRVLGASGGLPIPILLDWSPAGWRPISIAADDGLVRA